jgi:hypothetical protein
MKFGVAFVIRSDTSVFLSVHGFISSHSFYCREPFVPVVCFVVVLRESLPLLRRHSENLAVYQHPLVLGQCRVRQAFWAVICVP